MSSEKIQLVYDKQCPVCDQYCKLVRIKQDIGELKIVDARHDSEIMREITAHGLDIDQGMVLKVGEQIYYGADAIHALALLSGRVGIFNRFNFWLFKSRRVSHVLYPIFRYLRNLLLKILGRTKINNLGVRGNDRF